MIKRQTRINRIKEVAEEYRAGKTAADLLQAELKKNPSYGDTHGWASRAGRDFRDNLEGTYIVRLYAEFEATLRDYWLNGLGRDTEPPMVQLVNDAIPNQHFPSDYVEGADEVRRFRNYLVHDSGDEMPADVVLLSLPEVERRLKQYLSRLKADW
jgi:hypothetical protein